MTTLLSPHFSLEEIIATQVRGVDNTPPPAVVENLKVLALALEGVRKTLGNKPILITSGYRSKAVNARVGGSPMSDHPNGWCADFICPGFGSPLEICRAIVEAKISFDQLIEEGTWVHFSASPKGRGMVLTKNPKGGYIEGLPEST